MFIIVELVVLVFGLYENGFLCLDYVCDVGLVDFLNMWLIVLDIEIECNDINVFVDDMLMLDCIVMLIDYIYYGSLGDDDCKGWLLCIDVMVYGFGFLFEL